MKKTVGVFSSLLNRRDGGSGAAAPAHREPEIPEGWPRKLPFRKRPKPYSRAIPWAPAPERPALQINPTVRERDRPYELFVAQSVLHEVRQHLITASTDEPFGFLLGQVVYCPWTETPYVLVDAVRRETQNLPPSDEVDRFRHAWIGATRDARHRREQLIGWYHRHGVLGMRMSEWDLKLQDEFFPEPWQVALIVAASSRGPIGGFIQRSHRARLFRKGLAPFHELVDLDAKRVEGMKASVVDWTNYEPGYAVHVIQAKWPSPTRNAQRWSETSHSNVGVVPLKEPEAEAEADEAEVLEFPNRPEAPQAAEAASPPARSGTAPPPGSAPPLEEPEGDLDAGDDWMATIAAEALASRRAAEARAREAEKVAADATAQAAEEEAIKAADAAAARAVEDAEREAAHEAAIRAAEEAGVKAAEAAAAKAVADITARMEAEASAREREGALEAAEARKADAALRSAEEAAAREAERADAKAATAREAERIAAEQEAAREAERIAAEQAVAAELETAREAERAAAEAEAAEGERTRVERAKTKKAARQAKRAAAAARAEKAAAARAAEVAEEKGAEEKATGGDAPRMPTPSFGDLPVDDNGIPVVLVKDEQWRPGKTAVRTAAGIVILLGAGAGVRALTVGSSFRTDIEPVPTSRPATVFQQPPAEFIRLEGEFRSAVQDYRARYVAFGQNRASCETLAVDFDGVSTSFAQLADYSATRPTTSGPFASLNDTYRAAVARFNSTSCDPMPIAAVPPPADDVPLPPPSDTDPVEPPQ